MMHSQGGFSLPWLLFYGHLLGMGRAEIMATRYGEMLDLVACLAIYNGQAKNKKTRVVSGFENTMDLR